MGKVVVLGGDGVCGWTTALHLSSRGYDVVIVDNLSRRKIDVELDVESLTPIRPLSQRLRAWKAITGREIGYESFTVGDGNASGRIAAVLGGEGRADHPVTAPCR